MELRKTNKSELENLNKYFIHKILCIFILTFFGGFPGTPSPPELKKKRLILCLIAHLLGLGAFHGCEFVAVLPPGAGMGMGGYEDHYAMAMQHQPAFSSFASPMVHPQRRPTGFFLKSLLRSTFSKHIDNVFSDDLCDAR